MGASVLQLALCGPAPAPPLPTPAPPPPSARLLYTPPCTLLALLPPPPPLNPSAPPRQIDLGGGHVLEFVLAPNLHWPDTMFTYDHATSVMFTCDAFGLHYCSEAPFDNDVKAILPHYRRGGHR